MRTLLLLAAFACVAPMLRADDTEDFLNPKNWVGRDDLWKIEKNSVIGETKEDPKYNTFFVSKEKYANFELSFKVKLTDAIGNSGVQVRSKLVDDKKFVVHGPQVDVGKGYWGSLYGEGIGGMMEAAKPELIKKHVKETEFNTYKIVANGTKYTIEVNGEKFIDNDFAKTPDKKNPKDAPTEGIIAFQVHAGYPKMKVEYTDIVFKKLK
jgi:Domain of Unknown Function (DUF1080)